MNRRKSPNDYVSSSTNTWYEIHAARSEEPRVVAGYINKALRNGAHIPSWSIRNEAYHAFRFSAFEDAEDVAVNAHEVKRWIRWSGFVAIVKAHHANNKITREVVKRVGCPPLLQLALES